MINLLIPSYQRVLKMKNVVFAISFGLVGIVSAAHAQTGPISAAAAKAEGAKTFSASSCVATCKSRGNVQPPSDCGPKWCTKGRCYRSQFEAYCIK